MSDALPHVDLEAEAERRQAPRTEIEGPVPVETAAGIAAMLTGLNRIMISHQRQKQLMIALFAWHGLLIMTNLNTRFPWNLGAIGVQLLGSLLLAWIFRVRKHEGVGDPDKMTMRDVATVGVALMAAASAKLGSPVAGMQLPGGIFLSGPGVALRVEEGATGEKEGAEGLGPCGLDGLSDTLRRMWFESHGDGCNSCGSREWLYPAQDGRGVRCFNRLLQPFGCRFCDRQETSRHSDERVSPAPRDPEEES